MCKGEELDAFLARNGQDFDRVVYVGDGSNDFCPILRMRESVISVFPNPGCSIDQPDFVDKI